MTLRDRRRAGRLRLGPHRDPERARRFYGETLGLASNPGSPDEFETANVTLGLWEPAADGEPSSRTPRGSPCASPTSRRSRERLEASGVRFQGETVDTGVCHMAFFYDPDGNVLILHRRYA